MNKIFFLTSIIAFQSCFSMDQDWNIIDSKISKQLQYEEAENENELNGIYTSLSNFNICFNKLNEKIEKHKKEQIDSIALLQQKYTSLEEKTNKQTENIKTLASEIFAISGSFEQILDAIMKSKKDHEEGVKSVAAALNEKINKTNEDVTKIDTGVGTIVGTLGKMQNEISTIFSLWQSEVKRNDKNEQKINDLDRRISNVEGMIKKLCSPVLVNIYRSMLHIIDKNSGNSEAARSECNKYIIMLKEYVLENKKIDSICDWIYWLGE